MVRQRDGGAVIEVRVIPNAAKSALAGERHGAVLVRVAAPPVDSKANDALEAFLAGVLDLPKRAVTVVQGHTSRTKQVFVGGASADDVRRRLAPAS